MTTKFKAGDKVRVLKTGACSARVTEGNIGIHTGNGHRVNFPDQNDWWMISDSYLALADQPVEGNPWRENTGEMPVPKGTLVEVIHEDGDVCIGKAGEYGYAHRWDLGCGAGTIRKWRLVPDEKISEKGVDEVTKRGVLSTQHNETTNTQEEKHMTIKVGAQVIIKKSVEDFTHGSNDRMLRAQSQGTVLIVKHIDREDDIVVDHADWNLPAYVREHEIELASAAATSDEVVWEVAPKLVPFCVEASKTTARQANELLVLAKKLGARVVESVYDDDELYDVDEEFPALKDSYKYDLNNFNFVGVDNDNDTCTYDDTENFNNNVMTYADAKKMLEGIKAKTSTKQDKTHQSKVRPLYQRKLQIIYTNGKPYLLKNVVSVDVMSEKGTVNVTYNEWKGKVTMHHNVVIPFEELKSVKFVSPDAVGAEYIFKGGKVVQVIQDFSREAFTHKSH